MGSNTTFVEESDITLERSEITFESGDITFKVRIINSQNYSVQ